MKSAPLVSIAMCTFNGAKYLAEQLNTLVNQSYKPIEIIVVDDCSTDETLSILTKYAKTYPHFNIHQNKTNLGFTGNFERAVNLCKGQLIALCDQDDLWHPQKIELQVKGIEENMFIYHDSEFIHEDGKSMNLKISDLMNLYRGGDPTTFLFFNCVSGHSILMKKELLNSALPLKKEYFHDWWLAYVATNIGTIDYIPQCLVKYRQHDKNETDILRTKHDMNVYKYSSAEKIEGIRQWLGFCANFRKNKDQHLINQLYGAYTKRVNSFISFDLSILLFQNRRTILYIRKKGKLNALNYIYSQIWGVKIKKLHC